MERNYNILSRWEPTDGLYQEYKVQLLVEKEAHVAMHSFMVMCREEALLSAYESKICRRFY